MAVLPPFLPLARQLEEELLDGLEEDDPAALHARTDLQRINRAMGSAGILYRSLSSLAPPPGQILELGAGDGWVMLQLAKRLAPAWPGVAVTLLDRRNVVSNATRAAFDRLGWSVNLLQIDLHEWISEPFPFVPEVVTANLFIHHFDEQHIRRLFDLLSQRTRLFVACEPHRNAASLCASRLVGLLGANAVTRSDAVASVRAGFCRNELSSLWPDTGGWELEERAAGPFCHLFVARRRPGT